jgi:hypothetical protein
MCNSSSEERTWIELSEKLVKTFVPSFLYSSTDAPATKPLIATTQNKNTKKQQQHKQPLSEAFMFKEAAQSSRSVSKKRNTCNKNVLQL